MIGAAVLVGMGLLMLAGVGYLAWVTVVHRLVDSPPAIVEVSKDTADKDKSDKDKAAKDKGKTDTTKPSAKDASTPDKNDKPSTDGGYDVADG